MALSNTSVTPTLYDMIIATIVAVGISQLDLEIGPSDLLLPIAVSMACGNTVWLSWNSIHYKWKDGQIHTIV